MKRWGGMMKQYNKLVGRVSMFHSAGSTENE